MAANPAQSGAHSQSAAKHLPAPPAAGRGRGADRGRDGARRRQPAGAARPRPAGAALRHRPAGERAGGPRLARHRPLGAGAAGAGQGRQGAHGAVRPAGPGRPARLAGGLGGGARAAGDGRRGAGVPQPSAAAAHRPLRRPGDRPLRRRPPPCRRASIRTPCGTPSPPTCWRAAPTCAPSRSCSATARSRPPRSTPTSRSSAC